MGQRMAAPKTASGLTGPLAAAAAAAAQSPPGCGQARRPTAAATPAGASAVAAAAAAASAAAAPSTAAAAAGGCAAGRRRRDDGRRDGRHTGLAAAAALAAARRVDRTAAAAVADAALGAASARAAACAPWGAAIPLRRGSAPHAALRATHDAEADGSACAIRCRQQARCLICVCCLSCCYILRCSILEAEWPLRSSEKRRKARLAARALSRTTCCVAGWETEVLVWLSIKSAYALLCVCASGGLGVKAAAVRRKRECLKRRQRRGIGRRAHAAGCWRAVLAAGAVCDKRRRALLPDDHDAWWW